jgi:hypothetical protein
LFALRHFDIPRARWAIVVATLALQFLLQAYFFPLSEVLTQTPLHYIDSAFHEYQIRIGLALCSEHRILGYDPYFGAGYLGGITFNVSAKVPTLLACLAGSDRSVVPSYKIFSFVAGVLSPPLLVLAANALRFPLSATSLVAFISLLLWWTGPIRWYHTAGLVSFVLIAFASPAFGVALIRACMAPAAFSIALVFTLATIGLLVHPLFAVTVAAVVIPLLPAFAERAVWRTMGVGGLLLLAAIAANAWWLYPTVALPNIAATQPYQQIVDPWLLAEEPLGIAPTASGGSRIYIAVLIGTIGALLLSHGRCRRVMVGLSVTAGLLILFASLGGALPGAGILQPNRFSALAWVILCLPAAWGLVALFRQMFSGAPLGRLMSACATILSAAVLVYFLKDGLAEIFGQDGPRYAVTRPEVKGEGPISRGVIDWLQANTDVSARVFFETSLARVHDHAHMAGIYALASRREFIGGPYPFSNYASAWDGFAFGQRLNEYSPAQLSNRLDLYNVRWMICHSAACKAAMQALPGARVAATIETLTIFERSTSPGYFMSGRGRVVSSSVNYLEIEAEPAPAIVLKYHWVPGLRSYPAASVERLAIPGDPAPFIVVRNPPPRFVLRVDAPLSAPLPAIEPGAASGGD